MSKITQPSAAPASPRAEGECDWVIRKSGYFYRPNKCGYTASIFEAGRYTEQDAKLEAEITKSITAHPASEFAPPPPVAESGWQNGQHELLGFLAIHADRYQRDYGLNGLHPIHYDLMEKYGARMDGFQCATNAALVAEKREKS